MLPDHDVLPMVQNHARFLAQFKFADLSRSWAMAVDVDGFETDAGDS
jgi:hypothetical protein